MTKLLPLLLLLTATVCGWLTSCDNGCEQMRESFMHVRFVSTTSRSMLGVSIDAHGRREGVAISDSTTLQYMTTKLTKYDNIELELNPNDSLVTFVLHSDYTDYGDRFSTTPCASSMMPKVDSSTWSAAAQSIIPSSK